MVIAPLLFTAISTAGGGEGVVADEGVGDGGDVLQAATSRRSRRTADRDATTGISPFHSKASAANLD